MNKRIKKIMSFLMVCVLSIMWMSATAFAGTSSPPYETPTIYGHQYEFTSEVVDRYFTSGNTVEAFATVRCPDENVPAGYMGANARLYNSSGSLKASSGTTYNPSEVYQFFVYSPRISTPGQYYAQNTGSFYNGNGYNTYTGYISPVFELSSSTSESTGNTSKVIKELMSQTEYAVNDNGETYGSALSAYTIGVEPDLISAVGTNGVNGYVRADELTPKVSTIDEALAQMGNNGDVRTIPLYDVDGTTVLGEFELITRYELVTDAE